MIKFLGNISLILSKSHSGDLSTRRTGVNLNLIPDNVSPITNIYNFLGIVKLIVSESLKVTC